MYTVTFLTEALHDPDSFNYEWIEREFNDHLEALQFAKQCHEAAPFELGGGVMVCGVHTKHLVLDITNDVVGFVVE